MQEKMILVTAHPIIWGRRWRRLPSALVEEEKNSPEQADIVAAGLRQKEVLVQTKEKPTASINMPLLKPSSGTVMLEVEQGGIVVPSFVGKSVRSAVEVAAGSGLDLDVVGSGLAREQEPVAGSHVAAGSRVVVKFAR